VGDQKRDQPRRQPSLPYARIVRDLTDKIRGGVLLPGEQLPSVSQLCEDYSVSRVTVLKAMGELREAGLVTTIPRWGNFVAENPRNLPA
jgi:DNA-binding GntR family transcriptional regulator